jgi:hypothetical protein
MITTRDLDTREGVVAQLLTGAIQTLDLPPELRAHAEWRFDEIGTHLTDHGDSLGGAPWDVYPQGAFLLGTVISPVGRDGEYDVDLVCRRDIKPTSTTRMALKADTGSALTGYVQDATLGPVTLKEGNRCWTLTEEHRGFHADVLPAIPDPDGSGTGILLTDRTYARWLHSDPKGFAAWFKDRMKREFDSKLLKMAEARGSTIEAIPEYEVKTTLQVAVQALKRHRDVHFIDSVEMKPPSILLTTLAAHSYRGEQNLFDAVVMMADEMPRHVERDGQEWFVRNPVQPAENFADRWQTEPERRDAFFGWIESLKRNLDEIGRTDGIPLLSERMAKSFGFGELRRNTAVAGLGDRWRSLRDEGKLGMALGTGTLSVAGTDVRPIPRHGFYGAEDSAE